MAAELVIVIDADTEDTAAAPGLDWTVTEPCVVPDMPEDVYHADPVAGGSLSQSRLKLLLDPSTPAHFRYAMETPQGPKAEFDFGHAAHHLVLGVGLPLVEVAAADWRMTAARAMRDEMHAQGKVPLLTKDLAKVRAMAAALRAHPTAVELLTGTARELSAFAVDPESGLWFRGRFDAIKDSRAVDYKTTTAGGAHPWTFAKKLFDFGYDVQDATYSLLGEQLDLDIDGLTFVVQEKEPPYLVAVHTLDDEFARIGRARMREAINTYLRCADANHWPGYPLDISVLQPPRYVAARYADTGAVTATPLAAAAAEREQALADLDLFDTYLEGLATHE